MGHVIVFAIHERITAMPTTKSDRGRRLDVGGVKHLHPSSRRSVDIPQGESDMKRTTRALAPNACGGKFERNFPFTTPELP